MIAEIDLVSSKDYDVRCTNEDDYISALLINDYKAYILSLNSKKRIIRYEYAIKEFITNESFNKYIHDNKDELLYYISDTQFYLINKYNEFEQNNILEHGRWI